LWQLFTDEQGLKNFFYFGTVGFEFFSFRFGTFFSNELVTVGEVDGHFSDVSFRSDRWG
jgi:hypothetical protein